MCRILVSLILQVSLVLSWMVYQKTLLYSEKIMVFLGRLLFHFTYLNSFLHSLDTCLVFLYMYGNHDSGHNVDKLQGYLAGFHSSTTFKYCLNSVICFPSTNFGQKFFLSITDALCCVNVQCFCMVYCVIVKLITYFFPGSTNACSDCIEYISFVLSIHIIHTKYITV